MCDTPAVLKTQVNAAELALRCFCRDINTPHLSPSVALAFETDVLRMRSGGAPTTSCKIVLPNNRQSLILWIQLLTLL